MQLDPLFSSEDGQIIDKLQCEPAALFKPELLCETVKKKGDEELIAEEVAKRCQNAMKNVLKKTVYDVIKSADAKEALQGALKKAMNAALGGEAPESQPADKPCLRRTRTMDALKDKKGAKPQEAVITKVVDGVEHAIAAMAKQAIEAGTKEAYVAEVENLLTGPATNDEFKKWLHSAMDERLDEALKEELKQAEEKATKTLGANWLGYKDQIQNDPDAFLKIDCPLLQDVASTLSSRIAAEKQKAEGIAGATAECGADEQDANDYAAQQQAELACNLTDKKSYSECKHSLLYPAALRW